MSDDPVLVVEDDQGIALALTTALAAVGHQTMVASDGREALRLVNDHPPALVILDIGLPGLDGWQVLERIRNMSDVPVMILSARDLEADKVRGLMGGADDYLTKPFGKQELTARVHTLLRRKRSSGVQERAYDDGRLYVDFTAHEVHIQNHRVDLTPIEFRLLAAFVHHPGQVLSSEQLLEHAWNDQTGIGPDRVKFSILRLRRKLGWNTAATSPIEAVRGFGYRYVPPRR